MAVSMNIKFLHIRDAIIPEAPGSKNFCAIGIKKKIKTDEKKKIDLQREWNQQLKFFRPPKR